MDYASKGRLSILDQRLIPYGGKEAAHETTKLLIVGIALTSNVAMCNDRAIKGIDGILIPRYLLVVIIKHGTAMFQTSLSCRHEIISHRMLHTQELVWTGTERRIEKKFRPPQLALAVFPLPKAPALPSVTPIASPILQLTDTISRKKRRFVSIVRGRPRT